MSMVSQELSQIVETQKSQVSRGVHLIYLESEESLPAKIVQSYSEINSLRSQVDEMNRKLWQKEEECKKLKERVDTLTKQKLHRDNVIEEHKKVQADLRKKIETLKTERSK